MEMDEYINSLLAQHSRVMHRYYVSASSPEMQSQYMNWADTLSAEIRRTRREGTMPEAVDDSSELVETLCEIFYNNHWTLSAPRNHVEKTLGLAQAEAGKNKDKYWHPSDYIAHHETGELWHGYDFWTVYFKCAWSGEIFEKDKEPYAFDGNGAIFARKYMENETLRMGFVCQDCGEYFRLAMESDNSGTCQFCYDAEYEEECSAIKSYEANVLQYTKTRDQFVGIKGEKVDKQSTVFYGVELEVECDDSYCRASDLMHLSNFGDRIVMKRDGSLGEGFEIVTPPMTLLKHAEFWKPFAQFRGLRSDRGTGGRCGIHVHCSKAPLTRLHIAKIVDFVNRDENHDFINKVARRDCPEYAEKYQRRKLADNAKNAGKYSAVNICPTHTIEFRIFKGSTNINTIVRCVEFCDAVIRFTKFSGKREALHHKEFVKWVSDIKNRKTYPRLVKFLITKGFLVKQKTNNREALVCA